MLSASTETTAPVRALPQPQPRDARRPDADFGTLVDDNAAAATGDASRKAQADQPRDDMASAPNDQTAPDAPATAPAEKPETSDPKKDAASKDPSKDATADTATATSTDTPATAPATPSPEAVAVIVPVAPPAVQAPVASANVPPAPLALAAAALATAKAAGVSAVSGAAAEAGDAAASQTDAEGVVAKPATGQQKTAKSLTAGTTVDMATVDTGFAKQEASVAAPVAVAPVQQQAAGTTSESRTAAHAETIKPKDGTPDDAPAPAAQAAVAHDHRASTTTTPIATDTASIAPQPPTLQPAAPQPATSATQLTATVATSQPVPLNGLAVELATRAQSGSSRFDIRLDPAELGRIDVRIDIDRDGTVKSHLTVEKPETLAMLRQDSPQLQRALNDAGLKTADGGMQFTLGDQSQPRQNTDGGERQAQRFIIRDDEASTPVAPIRTYGRMAAARSGIDISV